MLRMAPTRLMSVTPRNPQKMQESSTPKPRLTWKLRRNIMIGMAIARGQYVQVPMRPGERTIVQHE